MFNPNSKLLTITVWVIKNGFRQKPAEQVFADWDVFWEYIRDCNIEDEYTLIITPLSWSMNKNLKHQVSASKNFGFWSVDLYERD